MTLEEYARARLRALLRTATAITGNPQMGEEIVQDVLVTMARNWERIEATGTGRDAYVRRMLVNEYLSWRRKWSRIVPVLPDGMDGRVASAPDHAERLADRDQLNRELARLPRKQQVVLALRFFDDATDADIAAALGCAESTVRSTASRALAALRVELSPGRPSTDETRASQARTTEGGPA